jgi:hypothetical protein
MRDAGGRIVFDRNAGLRPGVSDAFEPRRVGDRHSRTPRLTCCWEATLKRATSQVQARRLGGDP